MLSSTHQNVYSSFSDVSQFLWRLVLYTGEIALDKEPVPCFTWKNHSVYNSLMHFLPQFALYFASLWVFSHFHLFVYTYAMPATLCGIHGNKSHNICWVLYWIKFQIILRSQQRPLIMLNCEAFRCNQFFMILMWFIQDMTNFFCDLFMWLHNALSIQYVSECFYGLELQKQLFITNTCIISVTQVIFYPGLYTIKILKTFSHLTPGVPEQDATTTKCSRNNFEIHNHNSIIHFFYQSIPKGQTRWLLTFLNTEAVVFVMQCYVSKWLE